jgi:hypothetical protein
MTKAIQANELTLQEVESRFGLSQTEQSDFFPEWQTDWQRTLSELEEDDRRLLDRARTDFLYLAKNPVQEEIVKLVVLSPLLSAAGFYRHPFRPVAETQVELVVSEDEQLLRGRLDILVLNESLWVTVLESKNKRFNVLEALPQALFYMLANPTPQDTLFGLATNGSEFLFLKLKRGTSPQYATSRLFSLLNPGNDLYTVVGVLKELGAVVGRTLTAV